MKLKELLHGLDVLELHADEDLDITGVQYDSRQVTSGDLFVAISGFQTDGHRYIPKAMENGAVCVVCEKKPETDIAYVLVPDARAALAAVALLTLAQFGEGLLAVLLVIVCLVLLGLLTLHGGRRTAFGDEIVTQAMSYRRFLRRVTQSQLLSRLAQDSQYFYRILPYAEAIGLGAGLARTLGNTELEQCDWYQEQQPLPRTAAGFYSHLQEALALLELSIRK